MQVEVHQPGIEDDPADIFKYHVHPVGWNRFRSGNLRLWTSTPTAFDTQARRNHGIAVIGVAADWQWLCNYVVRTYGHLLN